MNNYDFYRKYHRVWICHNPSKSVSKMIKVVIGYLEKANVDYQLDTTGNLYAGDFSKERPCLVSHLDSVHREPTKKVKYKKGVITSDAGIGGDDKCGVIAALELLERNKDLNALFCIDEEIGCVGAKAVMPDRLEKVMYFLEIDRRGNDDIIYKSGGVELANEKFKETLEPFAKKYGFSSAWGSMTDVNYLTPKAKRCSINLSAGYNSPHNVNEEVVISDLRKSISFAQDVITNVRSTFVWEPPKPYVHRQYNYGWQNNTQNACDVAFETIEDVELFLYNMYLSVSVTKELEHLIQSAYDIGQADAFDLCQVTCPNHKH